jgi:hypothetical protein
VSERARPPKLSRELILRASVARRLVRDGRIESPRMQFG